MALRALLLRSRLDKKKKELEELRGQDADFAKREAELEAAIQEMTEETTEEERKEVEDQTEAFQKEKEEHEQKTGELEREIERIEGEIKEEEARSAVPPQPVAPAAPAGPAAGAPQTERKGERTMTMRGKRFEDMSIQERESMFSRSEVKEFVTRARAVISNRRAVGNTELIIPEIMLPMLNQIVYGTSKLLKYTSHDVLPGTARMVIAGEDPEGVWTEQCGTLNELTLGFTDVEMDGFKVGGFFKVCNYILEDNDADLTGRLMNALGTAIAKACDKAIVYGKGAKMPLGFVTRLAQETKPDSYSETEREWEDLHTSNLITVTGKKGVDLFKEIVKATKAIANDYSKEGLVWIMNKSTHVDLVVEAMGSNMAAAIVSGMSDTMPVIGGALEELEFMEDGDIAFGYLGSYKLVERKGITLGQSEHVKFLEDQTVFKGTARYDGKPVIAEAFAILNIAGKAPTTAATFPEDKANTSEETK